MIIDRTQVDVDAAKKIREEKIKKFKTLTDEDINTLERGMITYNTLNRIESKQAELRGIINLLGYWNLPDNNREWTNEDIFYKADYQRIIDNENMFRQAFFVLASTPTTPPLSFGYEDINSLERILYDLELMIDDVKSHYRLCGTFECGEE